MGGLPGSRLLKRLGVARGPDTILRRVKARQSTLRPDSVRVLGVDDWAWRKQQNYGTLLMDLEQSKVIDLLPDRSAESLARWLQGHPEVAIITRDRSGLYADGARKSAPFAAQITDRYHLVSNLAEAVERDVQQLQTGGTHQPAQGNQAANVRKGELRVVESPRAAMEGHRLTPAPKMREIPKIPDSATGAHFLESARKPGVWWHVGR